MTWEHRAARVHVVNKEGRAPRKPTERAYSLIVARSVDCDGIKYFLSNAAENIAIDQMIRVAFHRWLIEEWFEQAKQLCRFGDSCTSELSRPAEALDQFNGRNDLLADLFDQGIEPKG